jgi:dipeptidyl aminopeptidase/acylaminoacyl peptidase
MKTFVRLALAIAFAVSATPLAAPRSAATSAPDRASTAPDRELTKPNYELASRWTSAKIGKLVFSTSVTPHWLEFSDRFWYSYETPAGTRWWVVDPIKKTKAPMFDHAKMAAQLTRMLRTPYDAQHLPITTVKFIKNDTAIQFSVSLPRESKVEDETGQELDGMTQQDQETQQQLGGGRGGRGGGRGGQQVQQGGGRGEGRGGAANNKRWWLEYDLGTGALTLDEKYEPERDTPNWATVSPDKQTVIFARGHNLFMMDAMNYAAAQKKADDPAIQEVQLTTDGEKDYSYAGGAGPGGQQQDDQQDDNTQTGQTGQAARAQTEQDKKFGPRTSSIGVSWSQDSKRFAVTRQDRRKVADLWVINSLAQPRPRLETYKYGMPGEANQPQAEMQVFDVGAKAKTMLKTSAFKDQTLGLPTMPLTNLQREKQDTAQRWIAVGTDKVYYSRTSRDMKRVDIVEADTKTGESRIVIPERLNTYIETKPLRLLNGGKQLIHWSERDGWGHFYLYDSSGKLIRQITSGEFVCNSIEAVDEKTRTMYITAVGREPEEDPYYVHLYRVNIDTGEMKLLNPGVGSHASNMNDKNTYFIDTWSRVDTAPMSALYDTMGNKVLDLEKTDVSALLAQGYKFPETFAVKADDGVTDLYGVMYKPFDFDPAKKYPIIEFVYPGPQTESVTKTFSPRQANVSLAQFGFVVIEVGNRGGNPQRSKWYHNFGYGNLRDYGLADKKAAVEQLAKRHPWIDDTRVGIYGHSGGGFMSTAAMLVYPDFFKVAVSTSGNHDNSVYNRSWSEKHDGVKEVVDKEGNVTFEYDIDKNQDLAKNLKGKLLLMTGDIDNNVHPANTFRVIDALIKANKRFDFHIIPGKRHGYADATDWVFWIRADYFCRHLLGYAPDSADMVELQREVAMRR